MKESINKVKQMGMGNIYGLMGVFMRECSGME